MPDFLEFHLSYKDLDLDPDEFFPVPLGCGLAVHSPELFAGDHHLDLGSADEAYRTHSIRELQRVVDLTRHLTRHFPAAAAVPQPPIVIVSMGGFSRDGHVSRAERARRYERVAASLEQLDYEGVTLTAQTLPPFPWCFGGQMFHNLFVEADDTAAFCRATGIGLTLDVSHSQLAANHYGQHFEDFVEQVGPFVRHLHLVDAGGVDEEGLQIGDGCVDFGTLAAQLRRLAPNAGFIPEIWQGHIAEGSGFWTALDRLEKWFA
jgi:N-acetylneuraminate synthase